MENRESLPTFQAYGPAHLWMIVLTAVVVAVMVAVGRRRGPDAPVAGWELCLALTMLLSWPASFFSWWRDGTLSVENAYPLHLCNLSAFLAGIVLLGRWPRLSAILYFWGVVGAAQAIFTPALDAGFPRHSFFAFFFLHGGIIATAVYVVFGRGLLPSYGQVWEAVAWLVVYLFLVYPINRILGTNYGFLVRKPPTGSLLDYLGPWPWYILSTLLIAIIGFHLVYLPVLLVTRRRRSGRAGAVSG